MEGSFEPYLADYTIGDNQGNTPLRLACLNWGSNCEIMAALLAGHGQPPEASNENGAAPSATAFGVPLLRQQNNDGASPLVRACTIGKESYVKFLLEKGADPNTRDNHGTTPLLAASDGWGGSSDDAGILDLPFVHGADVTTKDEHGWTIEQIAQSRGYLSGCRI